MTIRGSQMRPKWPNVANQVQKTCKKPHVAAHIIKYMYVLNHSSDLFAKLPSRA